MLLEEIRKQAEGEKLDILPYMKTIRTRIKYGKAGDIILPRHLISKIEFWCDSEKLPFFHVTEDTCSIAPTYSELLVHEMRR